MQTVLAMPLIHVIYCSAARQLMAEAALVEVLERSRDNNASRGITGMLLYAEGSFFQVLEGEAAQVDELFTRISADPRHGDVVTIIREPIARRTFAEWTMGFVAMASSEVAELVGRNDFFDQAACFSGLDHGRAKKLLAAFRAGRWRARLRRTPSLGVTTSTIATIRPAVVSFAYQPIVDLAAREVVAYEALVRGPNNEPAPVALAQVRNDQWSHFDTDCRGLAIGKAAVLGVACDLNLKFLAQSAEDVRAAIGTTIQAAAEADIAPSRLVLEIDQDRLIGDSVVVARAIEEYRGLGLRISIAHFGAGRAGLNLLEPYRPDQISLTAELVRGIDSNGSRQAIVRGVAQTCADLGIDIVAKYVETTAEVAWFMGEGITRFQGDLFAPPGFECLPPIAWPAPHLQASFG
ncbi:MAG: diguanylate phosphodiesterase [Kofleriaceae bacterium]